MAAVSRPPIQPTSQISHRINFGNITYQNSKGETVTKGIYIYLLDENGNTMQIPDGYNHFPELIQTCNRLANDIIKNFLNENIEHKDKTITGFNSNGIEISISSANPVRPTSICWTQNTKTLWAALENYILNYFNGKSAPPPLPSHPPQSRIDSHKRTINPDQSDFKISVDPKKSSISLFASSQSANAEARKASSFSDDHIGFGLFD